MACGLIQRYIAAKADPPEILYIDRGCCNDNQLRRMFGDWPSMQIRLDIWHFMRRIASCVTTNAHPLYAVFMSKLATCIFEISRDDLNLLIAAKRSELKKKHVTIFSDDEIFRRISKRELGLHCRRKTRGTEQTELLIHQLLDCFMGEGGKDSLGTPLLDTERTINEWESQRIHIPCLQDPPGIQLYTRTGYMIKGGIQIPTFRCARGSVSLESFHLHLNRFIPGMIT